MKRYFKAILISLSLIISISGVALATIATHYLGIEIPATITITTPSVGGGGGGGGSSIYYPLTISNIGYGTVGVDPIQPIGGYLSGTQVTLTASANISKAFVIWGGDASGEDEVVVLTMNSAKNVTAIFSDVDLYSDLSCTTKFAGTLDFGSANIGGSRSTTLYFKASEINPATVNVTANDLDTSKATLSFSVGTPSTTGFYECPITITLNPIQAGTLNFHVNITGNNLTNSPQQEITPVIYDKVISGDETKFEIYPAIAEDANGKLYVVYSHYDSNTEDTTGKIAMRTSTDGGNTWSAESIVADTPSFADKNPVIGVFTYNGIEKLIVGWTPLSDCGGRVVTSPTSSILWGDTVSLGGNRIIGTGHPIQLSNGKLLIPTYSTGEGGAGNRDGYIFESSNGGASWTPYNINASHEMSEWSIIETKTGGVYTGGVYGLVRNNLHPLTFYEVFSTDYGHTFTEPVANEIVLEGQSPSRMIRLPNDDILAVYSFARTSNYAPPTTIRLSISSDEGQTWRDATDVIKYGSGIKPNYDQVDYADIILYDLDTLITVHTHYGYGTMANGDAWLNYTAYPFK